MSDRVIITKNDIEVYWPIGRNIDNARLLQHIKRAQHSELKPFMGEEFYYDFITNFTGTVNQELYNGGSYAYEGRTVFYGGLKELLAAWSYARLYAANQDFVGRGGNVRKETEESTPQDQDVTNIKTTEAKSEAIRLQAETWQFLDQKRSTYPLWQIRNQSSEVTLSSFKVTKVRGLGTVQKRGF